MFDNLSENSTKAQAAVYSLRDRIINSVLNSSSVCYQPNDHEGWVFDLYFRLIKVCSNNHHCVNYLLIAQSEDDDRTSEEIKKLFKSKIDRSKIEVLIEKYE